jgi:hypothetical protein
MFDTAADLPDIGEDPAGKTAGAARIAHPPRGDEPSGWIQMAICAARAPARVRCPGVASPCEARDPCSLDHRTARGDAGGIAGLQRSGGPPGAAIRTAVERDGIGRHRIRIDIAPQIAGTQHTGVRGMTGPDRQGRTVAAGTRRAGPTRDPRVVARDGRGAALHCLTGVRAHGVACRDRGRTPRRARHALFAGRAGAAPRHAANGPRGVAPILREIPGKPGSAGRGTLAEPAAIGDAGANLHTRPGASDGRTPRRRMTAAATARRP